MPMGRAMLIATFNATEWAGTDVYYDGAGFVVEGVGWISALQIVVCARQRSLTWASLRARELTLRQALEELVAEELRNKEMAARVAALSDRAAEAGG